jgi:hypothetical protein
MQVSSRRLPGTTPRAAFIPRVRNQRLLHPAANDASGERWVIPGSHLFNTCFNHSSLSEEYNGASEAHAKAAPLHP